MTQPLIKLLLVASVAGLMACSGGGDSVADPNSNSGSGGGGTGGTGSNGDGGPTPPPDMPTGTNGLDFGEAGQSLSEVETVAVTTRSASFQSGTSTATTGAAVVTLDEGFLTAAPTARSGTVQIGDETVTITNGSGALSTGEAVIATYEDDRSGTYVGVLEVSIAGATDSAINGETVYVFGFETDPDTLDDRTTGRLEYTGGFQAFGSLNDADDTSTEFEGDMTILVDFAGDASADVTLDGQLNGTTSADLAGTLAVTGNGFSGTLNCTAGCTDNGSSIDAGFYGPDADEVAGVIGVGITADGDDFDGVGSFILTDPIAR